MILEFENCAKKKPIGNTLNPSGVYLLKIAKSVASNYPHTKKSKISGQCTTVRKLRHEVFK